MCLHCLLAYCLFLAHFLFSYSLGSQTWGMMPPMVDCDFPHQLTIKKILADMPSLRLSFQVSLGCINLTAKTNHTAVFNFLSSHYIHWNRDYPLDESENWSLQIGLKARVTMRVFQECGEPGKRGKGKHQWLK